MTGTTGDENAHVCRFKRRPGCDGPSTVTDEDGNVWCATCPTILSTAEAS